MLFSESRASCGARMPAGVWDEEAITRAHVLLAKRKGPFDSFEVWEGSRFVFSQTFPAVIPDAHPPRRHAQVALTHPTRAARDDQSSLA